jgi:hypothetical protein
VVKDYCRAVEHLRFERAAKRRLRASQQARAEPRRPRSRLRLLEKERRQPPSRRQKVPPRVSARAPAATRPQEPLATAQVAPPVWQTGLVRVVQPLPRKVPAQASQLALPTALARAPLPGRLKALARSQAASRLPHRVQRKAGSALHPARRRSRGSNHQSSRRSYPNQRRAEAAPRSTRSSSAQELLTLEPSPP